jgi:hypothetical protein
MKVSFYKFHNGHVQQNVIEKVEQMTKAGLMKIADLRHPVFTKKEFYNVLSTDRYGNIKKDFRLMTLTHYLIVETV